MPCVVRVSSAGKAGGGGRMPGSGEYDSSMPAAFPSCRCGDWCWVLGLMSHLSPVPLLGFLSDHVVGLCTVCI